MPFRTRYYRWLTGWRLGMICWGMLLLSGILFAQVFQVASAHQTVHPLQDTAVEAVVARAQAAWIDGDADAFANLFTPDGEFVVPGLRLRGQAAIRKLTADVSAKLTDVTIEIRRIILDEDQAAVEWYWEDTNPETGQRNRADDVVVIDFIENRIKKWREYIDIQTPQLNQGQS